ncbi:hypothetical protein LTS15_000558 [Exophiala xenobiotica]|nr:hypothetical protein LTS15_000558 [Exophiala xenobiotica]
MNLYAPLKSPRSTRLLTLNPGDFEDDVIATLAEVDLAERPSYEAVSYAWGPPGSERQIIVNGVTLWIRQNLWQGLRRVRRKHAARTVWIDAISISQTDLLEKGEQVAKIGEIFSAAERVLVWVGEHDMSSEKLFTRRSLRENAEWFTQQFSLRLADRISKGTPMSRRPMWWIWRRFLNRPYFRRTWIVQETVHAKAIVVCCGGDSKDWAELIGSRIKPQDTARNDKPHKIYNRIRKSHSFTLPISHVAELQKLRLQHHKASYLSLQRYRNFGAPNRTIIELIRSFSVTECVDKRDKVYALLSLVYPPLPIRPDYTKSVADVYVAICRCVWGEHKKVNRGDAATAKIFLDLDVAENSELLERLLTDESNEFSHDEKVVFVEVIITYNNLDVYPRNRLPIKLIKRGTEYLNRFDPPVYPISDRLASS